MIKNCQDRHVENAKACPTAVELAFLTEYISVTKPLAQALNILQSDTKMLLGYLVPTVSMLHDKLTAKPMFVTVCKPLIVALL